MKNLKKLPTKQLEKFSNIFTQLGLVLVLFIVYLTLEHQTEQKTIHLNTLKEETIVCFALDYSKYREDVIFQREPKVKIPKTILILDEPIEIEDDNIPEIFIDDAPMNDPVLIDLNNVIAVEEPPVIIDDVPYDFVQNAPVFKGCEGLSKEDNKICFAKKMKQFVQQNFDTNLANELGLRAGKHKIYTQFTINHLGNIVDINIRAPHIKLKNKTENLIRKLPKFKPGKQNNKTVKVKYTLPITFSVE